MLSTTDDLRITELKELSTPDEVMGEIPRTLTATRMVMGARNAIHTILNGTDDRLLVVVGPCSIHDPAAALDYATRLADAARTSRRPARDRHARLFREAAHDRRLEGPDQRSRSRRQLRHRQGPAARAQLLLDVNNLGLPAGAEFLDMTTPQYIADLVAWGAIGARTTESQIHRELASGLSCPVGFKNGTDGNVRIAARRGEIGLAAAPFPGGDQGRAFGDRHDHRQ